MPESAGGSNVEIAHHLVEHEHAGAAHSETILEIAEAFVLAVIAIATAWCGYQAALWTGHQAELYATASKLRVQAEGATTTANQLGAYNADNVVNWLQAEAQGQTRLAALFERRFSPGFRPAFEAWKKTNPLDNPHAPAGPTLMPNYRNAMADKAAQLDKQATITFEDGTAARDNSDQYVRLTVTLAAVLLLMAISQRFKIHGVRIGLVILAVLILIFPLYHMLVLPRV